MAEHICPRCQNTSPQLAPVSQVLRQKFKVIRPDMPLPNALCSSCMVEVTQYLGQSSATLVREKSKEESKSRLWRSRVGLLKRGRNLMKRKSFGEAIASYEKYLKLVEVVFEVSEADLRPEIFKERMATKELTIITSVYWDLLRVYDNNEKYQARMHTTAQKLVQFAPLTPILMDIVKKAESYKRQARNPDVFKNLIRDLMYKRNHCFIATSVFENPLDWHHIDKFRLFRDKVLLRHRAGKTFVAIYYKLSPAMARFFDRYPLLKLPIKMVLTYISRAL